MLTTESKGIKMHTVFSRQLQKLFQRRKNLHFLVITSTCLAIVVPLTRQSFSVFIYFIKDESNASVCFRYRGSSRSSL